MSTLHLLGAISLVFVVAFTWHQARAKDDTQAGRQTRWQSVLEAWQNIAIGMALNWSANFFLLPLVHASFTALDNFLLGCIYTSISLLRQYAIRRRWEMKVQHDAARAAEKLA